VWRNDLDSDVAGNLLGFVERTTDFVGVIDGEGGVSYLNEAALKRLGIDEWTGMTLGDLFHPDMFGLYYDEIRPALLHDGTWHGNLTFVANNETTVLKMTIVATIGAGGEVQALVAIGREADAPPLRSGSTDLVHDDLTNVAGRAILEDRLRVALSHAARDERRVAVVLADVDGLKDINDSFGHAVGDDVLRNVADVMSGVLRTSDTVARLGGDEFVLLLDGIDETDGAWQVAERVRDAVCRTQVESPTGPLAITASFGVALAEPNDTPETLLQRADAGMYRAKATGGGSVTIIEASDEANAANLADELAFALSHGLIRPHVQAVVDLETSALVGYQGVARWQHPRRGLLDAEQFVHAAASTPLMPVIDLAVLRHTSAVAARSERRGRRVHAYGHVSRRLLGDDSIERYLTEIIEDLDIEASDLCIEIGHALIARRSRAVQRTLRGLRQLGVRIVLSGVDGECDVNELVEYGFDQLRLSLNLVHDTRGDPVRRRVALGTIALARALGLTVIAVGIETERDRSYLRDAGCNYGEGRYFGSLGGSEF
jgi:diguanylate cyclase (GGDEF)-like protein